MTSTVSTDKKSFFGAYYLYKLKTLKNQFILCCIFSVVAMPLAALCHLPVLNDMEESLSLYAQPSLSNFAGMSWLCLIIGLLVLLGLFMLMPALNFSYYNKKDRVDVSGALPLTFSQRFWGDTLSGLTVCLAPFTVCLAIAAAIFIPRFCQVISVLNRENVTDLPVDKIAPYLLMLAVTGIICMVAGYLLSLFVTVCSGRFSASVLFSIVIALIIPFFAAVCVMACGGNGTQTFTDAGNILSYLPPFGTVIAFTINGVPAVQSLGDLLIILALFAVVLLASYFIAKYRKAEKTGEHFAINAVYHALTAVSVGAVLLLALSIAFNFELDSYSSGITAMPGLIIALSVLFTIIPLVVLDIFHYRNFAKMWRTAVKYAACAGGALGLYLLMSGPVSQMALNYSPATDDIECTYLSVSTPYEYAYSYSDLELRNDYIDMFLCDSKGAEFAKQLQEKAISVQSDSSPSREVSIDYALKNGRHIRKSIRVGEDLIFDALEYFGGIEGVLDTPLNPPEINNVNIPSLKIFGGDSYNNMPELISALKYDIANDNGKEKTGYFTLWLSTETEKYGGYNFNFSIFSEPLKNDSLSLRIPIFINDGYTKTLELIKSSGFNFDEDDTPLSFAVFSDDYRTVEKSYDIPKDAIYGETGEKIFELLKLTGGVMDIPKNSAHLAVTSICYDRPLFYVPEENVDKLLKIIEKYERTDLYD